MKRRISLVLGIVLVGAMCMGNACEDAQEACGLTCPDVGITGGNASITGVASIDGFFGAVTNFSSKANMVSANIDAELAAIAASVGLAGGAEADFAGGFQAAVAAKFNLDASAGISIEYQEPKCEVSASASIEATAKCDVSVDPGSATVECSGSCEVDPGKIEAEMSAACEVEADAKLTCTGTAPSLACEGTCTGGCELEVAASCEGTCNGTCSGTCSLENADGSCAGQCDGDCQGSCELEAGGSCGGKCTGSCEYTPATAECSAGATAEISCDANASADVEPPSVNCSASCSGEVTPPSASADCEASAKAEAELNAECTPPSIAVSYQFDATAMGSLDADAEATMKAEFKAWLGEFKAHVGAIAAASAQADVVLKAGLNIGAAAETAVQGAADAIDLEGDPIGSYRVLKCLPAELAAVPDVITGASASLEGSVSATVSLMGVIKK